MLTLREIPAPFRSVLSDDACGSADAASWTLDARTVAPHPCAFGGVPMPGAVLAARAVPVASPAAVAHSAERLANAIVLATTSPGDLRTLTAWGQRVGVSRGALRVWCRAAGVSARASLDFLRVLRAILHAEHQPWDLLNLLDVVDERSIVHLLKRGGVRELCRDTRPTVDAFLVTQRFLDDDRLRQAIAVALQMQRDSL